MENFNEELAVKRVVDIIKKYYRQSKKLTNLNISKKERNDIVTDIDLFMGKNIIKDLSQYYPTHSFKQKKVAKPKKIAMAISMNG